MNVVSINLKPSSKGKAINYTLNHIDDIYDGVVILDADNIVDTTFLSEINNAWIDTEITAIQAHRVAKNLDTSVAYLDAVSEEINNTIFRKGHVALGCSSALIGSGMAIDFNWLKDNAVFLVSNVEDKELELRLLQNKVKIKYLENTLVLDEKIKTEKAFATQRHRWISGKIQMLPHAVLFIKSLMSGNIDLADKLFQWVNPPRSVLLAVTILITTIVSIKNLQVGVKWIVLSGVL